MNNKLTRRSFVRNTALAAGVMSAAPFNILTAANKGDKIRVVQIGCGGRGVSSHLKATINEKLVAVVDVDDKKLPAVKKLYADKQKEVGDLQVFTDYRKMFDKLHKEIDAVFIATPNHQHALPAMMAMHHGINVY